MRPPNPWQVDWTVLALGVIGLAIIGWCWLSFPWRDIVTGPSVILPPERTHRTIYHPPPASIEEELERQVEKAGKP